MLDGPMSDGRNAHLEPAIAVKQDQSGRGPNTLERLLRAQAAVAYAMTLDGPIYAPLFERLELELATMRAADDVMARAKRCLEEATQPLQLLQAPE